VPIINNFPELVTITIQKSTINGSNIIFNYLEVRDKLHLMVEKGDVTQYLLGVKREVIIIDEHDA
jgi:hypothetical protein